jgi:hypothetical protein
VSHGASGELLAGGEFGLHRSEDGGATWQRVPLASAPGGFDRVAVAHDPGGQVTYVFAAGDGVGHLWRRDHPGGPFDFDPVKPPADLDSRRAWHSWACAVDPGDPGVVWLGAAGLHRGAQGPDGRWSWVDLAARPAGDSLPVGQHAVVFEPGDPLAVYVANEGGLFRSPDGGRSWRSLVTGLAVAEVDRLADHAAWLLAGAGELGALRYEGGEVWCPVGTGDPALLAGDELVTPGPGGLAVSADGGSTWTAAPLPGVEGAVTTLALSGPAHLLAGTTDGELLRVERIEDAWTVAGTARPRPGRVAGVAVDPSRPEVAWAAWSDHQPGWGRPREAEDTSSADHNDGPGRPPEAEDATHHGGGRVWRSGDGGATWDDRGGGLPEVPVGAVVPDPERPGTVVVATDAGVWWSEDDGAGWRPLGAGLPNAPALALALRRPERLLRVGLLGRGVWELPLDADSPTEAATPALRSGRSPAARPRPGGPWWECPDIKLEVPPRPREEPVTPVEFEDDRWPGATGLPELGGRVLPDRLARVHVQVHHRGDGPLRDVQVRVLAVPACLRPPDLPTGDWVLGGAPPAGSPWRPVGPPAAIGDLHPGRSAVASFDWQVPWDLPPHVCLLALAATGGPEAGGLWTAVPPQPADRLASPPGGPDPGRGGSGAPPGTAGPDQGREGSGAPPGTAGPDPGLGGPDAPPGTAGPGAGPGLGPRPEPGGSGGPSGTGSAGAERGGFATPQGAGGPGPGLAVSGVAVDPADLAGRGGGWGLKSLTVVGRDPERVLMLDLLGSAGRGPFTLAAEGWVGELVAGLVLPRRLGGLAREAGLVAERVGEVWRPELVDLVRGDPRLAERVDLGSAFAIPAGRGGAGLDLWLQGMELSPERPDPLLLLLREPPHAGRGCLLLLDVDGGVLGGHTFQVAR